ncbi:MAG: hypothetical protein SOZ09_01745, partial [Eubacteriales bacterium]|nr:hypothetical protein [Eubacteriales bacterium]
MALVVSFVFLNEEYHIALVDFIVALRRTKGRGRRTLRSPPSPSSGLHLIHPWNPLRRGISAAAVDRDLGSWYPVQTVHPHFDVVFGGSVFGLVSFAFQKITLGIGSFVFHYWMEKRRCSDGFVVSFFGLPLTATLYQFRWVQAHFINVAGCK